MSDAVFRVLVLCTGNSARSILAESLLNHWGAGRVIGYSAGSHPKGQPHSLAIELLNARGMPTDGLRSKSWDQFAAPDSPSMNLVITVCDSAMQESCPLFPGDAIKVHWGIPDPAATVGDLDIKRAAFLKTYRLLENRIALLIDLPLTSLSNQELQFRVQQIAGSN